MSRTIRKVLIANRGEIACRIMRTLRKLEITSLAVYSEADANAAHVRLADEALLIGPSPATESYLLIENIIRAALETGADAIHPGYGFLAENPDLPKACEDNGIIFIGPPSQAIEAMGSKSTAKKLMGAAGVPLVPGFHEDGSNPQRLRQEALAIGFPLLIKATHGGGGKGMRLVNAEDQFDSALASCQRESGAAFGETSVLLEKFIGNARHVEIQVFTDQCGNGVYLFERDCSIQRRHQKIIEEAPAPGITPALRATMGEAALKAARAIHYVGAGTVEFLLDTDGSFYFMEMNTRLQVEHPVTEMITGLDLVEWQLLVAEGAALPCDQSMLEINGHAIEARIYAEAPLNEFLPSTGTLEYLATPTQNRHTRIDAGVGQGDDITVFYDPMISKLIVWDLDRDKAIHRLLVALRNYRVAGLSTNIEFLQAIALNQSFRNATLSTQFVDQHLPDLIKPNPPPTGDIYIYAALFQYCSEMPTAGNSLRAGSKPSSPWDDNKGWQLNAPHSRLFTYCNEDEPVTVEVRGTPDRLRANCQGTTFQGSAMLKDDRLTLEQHSRSHIYCYQNPQHISLFINGVQHQVETYTPDFQHGAQHDEGSLHAPMNGRIVSVLVSPGDRVEQGQPLMVMEAMKMEHSIKAPDGGTIKEIYYRDGDLVDEGAELIHID